MARVAGGSRGPACGTDQFKGESTTLTFSPRLADHGQLFVIGAEQVQAMRLGQRPVPQFPAMYGDAGGRQGLGQRLDAAVRPRRGSVEIFPARYTVSGAGGAAGQPADRRQAAAGSVEPARGGTARPSRERCSRLAWGSSSSAHKSCSFKPIMIGRPRPKRQVRPRGIIRTVR